MWQNRHKPGNMAVLVQANFAAVAQVAQQRGFWGADGCLMDLGLSSLQLAGGSRGFSFLRDGPLAMQFDPGQRLTAADILNRSTEEELTEILLRFGEERRARRISRAIVRARPLATTQELARVVEHAVGGRRGRLHPATRTFQALRMAVNRELENLEAGLGGAIKLLGPGGRLAVISYESLSDRLVKVAMRRASSGCICPPGSPVCTCGHTPELRLITRKPLTPSREEVQRNPRSRSARLRVAERL
jgi:16S rRNA (cytosine1402-N4)-methyltransferase